MSENEFRIYRAYEGEDVGANEHLQGCGDMRPRTCAAARNESESERIKTSRNVARVETRMTEHGGAHRAIPYDHAI